MAAYNALNGSTHTTKPAPTPSPLRASKFFQVYNGYSTMMFCYQDQTFCFCVQVIWKPLNFFYLFL